MGQELERGGWHEKFMEFVPPPTSDDQTQTSTNPHLTTHNTNRTSHSKNPSVSLLLRGTDICFIILPLFLVPLSNSEFHPTPRIHLSPSFAGDPASDTLHISASFLVP